MCWVAHGPHRIIRYTQALVQCDESMSMYVRGYGWMYFISILQTAANCWRLLPPPAGLTRLAATLLAVLLLAAAAHHRSSLALLRATRPGCGIGGLFSIFGGGGVALTKYRSIEQEENKQGARSAASCCA